MYFISELVCPGPFPCHWAVVESGPWQQWGPGPKVPLSSNIINRLCHHHYLPLCTQGTDWGDPEKSHDMKIASSNFLAMCPASVGLPRSKTTLSQAFLTTWYCLWWPVGLSNSPRLPSSQGWFSWHFLYYLFHVFPSEGWVLGLASS